MPINIQQALDYRFNPDAINQAKQMGWSDGQINAYKQQIYQTLSQQNAVEQAKAAQASAATQQQPQDQGNWLTHLLPSGGSIAGGLAGAAGGAAIGSVVPIVGTGIGAIIGGLLGGAGGGAGGKVAENAVEGNKDLGSGVANEALMGGLTSLPVGAAFKIGQAGFKAATGIGKAGIGDLLAQAGAKTVPKAVGGLLPETAGQAVANAGATNARRVLDAAGNVINPSLGEKFGNAISDTANGQLAKNQLSLTRANVRQIGGFDPAQLIGNMRQNYGLSNLEDINKLGQFAGGKAGLDNGQAVLTNMVENAAASGQGIDRSGLQGIVDKYAGQLDTKDMNKLNTSLGQAHNTIGFAGGVDGGMTNPNLGDPVGGLRAARDLAEQAFQIKNAPNATVSEGYRANALQDLSNEIKNRVYNGQKSLDAAGGGTMTKDAQAAVNDGVAQLRQQAQLYLNSGNKQFGTALNALADKAASAPDLKSLDAIVHPFVQANQAARMSTLGTGGAAMDVGNIKNTATGMVNGLAGDLIRPGLNNALGKLSDLGSTLSGNAASNAGTQAAASTLKGGLSQDLRGAVVRNLVERAPGAASRAALQQANTVDLPDGADPSDPTQTDALADPSQSGATDTSGSFGGLTQDQVQQAMVQAVQAGDTKQLANLAQLNNAMTASAKNSASAAKATPAQLKDQQAVKDAQGYLTSLEQNLQNAGGAQGPAGSTATIPVLGQFLNPKGSAYQSTLIDTATALAKAMTGGKPSSQQIDQWKHSLPQVNDSPAIAAYKLQNIRNSLANKLNGMATGGGSSTDLSTILQDAIAAQGQ